MAPAYPAGPPPITIRSYSVFSAIPHGRRGGKYRQTRSTRRLGTALSERLDPSAVFGGWKPPLRSDIDHIVLGRLRLRGRGVLLGSTRKRAHDKIRESNDQRTTDGGPKTFDDETVYEVAHKQ